jgi:hypothetical protein
MGFGWRVAPPTTKEKTVSNTNERAGGLSKSLLDEENPNASSEYKALLRRLAQLVVEDTERCLQEDGLSGATDLAEEAIEASLNTWPDFHTAIHDVARGSFPRQTQAEWVSGLCLDAHDEWEEKAQTTGESAAWENEALWASAAYNLQEVDD